jgi:hypothetical protein
MALNGVHHLVTDSKRCGFTFLHSSVREVQLLSICSAPGVLHVIISVASWVTAGLTGQLDLFADLGARSGWAATKVLTGHDARSIEFGKGRIEKVAICAVRPPGLGLKMLRESFSSESLRVRTQEVRVIFIGIHCNGLLHNLRWRREAGSDITANVAAHIVKCSPELLVLHGMTPR